MDAFDDARTLTSDERASCDALMWRTADEVNFVRGLGTHRVLGGPSLPGTPERLRLLRAYRRTMASRVKWGAIDRAAVEQAVDGLIAGLTSGIH